MSVRQYIGARYIPIFFDNNGSSEWVQNHSYEPLTIVTYLGNSYTSKKLVPSNVGNPADNSEYWASTGIYNAQVEAYREEVEALAGQLDQFEDDFLDFNTFKNMPMLLMGNSWAAGAGGTIGHGFTYYMQQYCGCDASFIQCRGGDFVATGNSQADYPNKTAIQALNAWATGQTSAKLNSIRMVVYGGGLNDAYEENNSYDAEYAAVDAFVKRVKVLMPNAKIYIIPLCGLNAFPSAHSHSRTYQAIIDATVNNGGVSNNNYLTWFYGRLEYKTSEDNYNHLNDDGYKLLANYVLAMMRGWDGNCVKPSSGVTPVKNTEDNYNALHIINDGSLITIAGYMAYTGTTTGKLTNGDTIAKITNPDMRPMSTFITTGLIYDTSDATKRAIVGVQIETCISSPGFTITDGSD